MTAPAVRFDAHILMTGIAELLLVGMTVETGVRKTLIEASSIDAVVCSLVGSDNLITPDVEQIHVFGGYLAFGHHALLFPGDVLCKYFDLRSFRTLPHGDIKPDRRGDQDHEYDQTEDDFPPVIHRQPPFPAEVHS